MSYKPSRSHNITISIVYQYHSVSILTFHYNKKRMATHVSAEKRNRQNKRINTRNRKTRSEMRTAIKEVVASVAAKDSPKAKESLKKTTSLIAKAANKGLLHKKNVARKVSRLTRRVNAI